MTKDKADKLVKYAQELSNKLTSNVSEKHKNHPVEYKQFLTRELQTVNNQLADYKLQDKK